MDLNGWPNRQRGRRVYRSERQGTSPSTSSQQSGVAVALATRDERFAPLIRGAGEPAVVIDADYQIVASNQAYCDRFARGEPVCGRRCFEVSHGRGTPCSEGGESCPIGRCKETGTLSRTLHVHCTLSGADYEEVLVHPLPDESGRATVFVEYLRPAAVGTTRPIPGELVGRSPTFRTMLELVTRVAPSQSTVLLLGESGSGKERVARALHTASTRASRAFVPVDCSGLSESLFESELFGHEKGAFTGAYARKRGLVEAAQGGTLFLDEVGDIPLTEQVKLLRLLETGVFRRVGGVDELRADFRLVCATHRDIAAMVADGTFRRDLYYRIATFPIHIPPLRERREDISLLIDLFLGSPTCRRVKKVSDEALALLQGYGFPGNVRELHNIVERACLLADGEVLLPDHLPEEICAGAGPFERLQARSEVVPLVDVETEYLRWAAQQFTGVRADLARCLGLSERTLYRKLRQAQLRGSGASSPCTA